MEPTLPITSKHLLVVEDNDSVRRAIVQILQIDNYYVHQAEDGKVAVEILNSIKPDLILSDIYMPNMNGLELFEFVRHDRRFSAIPFVFLTDVSRTESHKTIQELGVEDWVSKPINSEALTRTIHARLLRAAEVKYAHIDQAYIETVEVLANAVEGRDHYTRGHIERVTTYTLWLAKALRWPQENIRTLIFGARLHDIGKIIVPDRVLNKPDALTSEELKLMMKHPVAGANILKKISHLAEAIPYVLYHHEKWDGSGYPEGLKGKKIPLGARVLALADVFDALTTSRPYRLSLTRNEVFRYLEDNIGKHFDPDLGPLFIDIVGKNVERLVDRRL